MLLYFINNNSTLQQEPKLKVPLRCNEIEEFGEEKKRQKCINIGLSIIVE